MARSRSPLMFASLPRSEGGAREDIPTLSLTETQRTLFDQLIAFSDTSPTHETLESFFRTILIDLEKFKTLILLVRQCRQHPTDANCSKIMSLVNHPDLTGLWQSIITSNTGINTRTTQPLSATFTAFKPHRVREDVRAAAAALPRERTAFEMHAGYYCYAYFFQLKRFHDFMLEAYTLQTQINLAPAEEKPSYTPLAEKLRDAINAIPDPNARLYYFYIRTREGKVDDIIDRLKVDLKKTKDPLALQLFTYVLIKRDPATASENLRKCARRYAVPITTEVEILLSNATSAPALQRFEQIWERTVQAKIAEELPKKTTLAEEMADLGTTMDDFRSMDYRIRKELYQLMSYGPGYPVPEGFIEKMLARAAHCVSVHWAPGYVATALVCREIAFYYSKFLDTPEKRRARPRLLIRRNFFLKSAFRYLVVAENLAPYSEDIIGNALYRVGEDTNRVLADLTSNVLKPRGCNSLESLKRCIVINLSEVSLADGILTIQREGCAVAERLLGKPSTPLTLPSILISTRCG